MIKKQQAPVSKRRWMIIRTEDGKPTLGCPSDGISLEDRARRISESYVIETEVVAHHEYYNLDDPDQEEE